MVSAEVNCTPPAIPAPCSKPPNIPRTYFVRRLIAVNFSRRGTFRHVDSRQPFILSSCGNGLFNATILWAKHAFADRNRTQREQEANTRACFLISFLPGTSRGAAQFFSRTSATPSRTTPGGL